MAETQQDKDLQFDTKILSKFIYALNIARQHVASYPGDHPIIAGSTNNVLRLLSNLLEFQEQITLGIFRDTLLVADATLDPRNPVYRKLAGELFDLGVAALSFRRSLTRAELLALLQAICRGREAVDAGQQPDQLHQLEMKGLAVTFIDYTAFAATDEEVVNRTDPRTTAESVSLWDRFIEGMIAGNIDPHGDTAAAGEPLDPQLAAAYLNRQRSEAPGREASYEESITSFLRELDQEGRGGHFRTEALEKLSAFVDNLSPELRHQFLSSTFNKLETSAEVAEEVMNHLSSDVLLETLAEVNAQRLTIPPAVMNLLGKLSQHSGRHSDQDYEETRAALSSTELGEQLKALFREDDPDRYIPGTYQHMLHCIVATEDIPALEGKQTDELRDRLAAQSVEKQLCLITLELLRTSSDPDQQDRLAETLHELMLFFLETGEFVFLVDLYERMRRGGGNRAGGAEFAAILLQPEFLGEVLAALGAWGKDKFPAITELIRKVGTPFIEPLLDQLAAEKRMALRRFYMARLAELGGSIREPLLARLRDPRWYFVRNLIVLLRDLNDPVTLHALRTLVRHPHPQVRLDAAKTLLKLGDPAGASRFILDELSSADPEREERGLAFAARSCTGDLLPGLHQLLERKDGSEGGWARKHAAVRLLGQLAQADTLPVLERILLAKNLLQGRQLARLKEAILRSLAAYPRREVQPILELQVANGGDLGALARTLLETPGRAKR